MNPSMDSLPCELFVEILSFLDIGQLFEVRQVCTRWQTTIDECSAVWRRKRTITERDLGVYLSLESKLTRLIYFLKKRTSIDYYFFPVLIGERKGQWLLFGITKETEECLKQLYVLLKELFSEGRIPVNLDAVNFIENMIHSLARKKDITPRDWQMQLFLPDQFESECSISKCRSIIVPTWPPDKNHVKSYGPWLKYLIVKMGTNLEEIIIEKMLTHSYAVGPDGEWPSLRVDTGTAVYGPSRVRVLSVVGDHHHHVNRFLPSVRLRPDCQLFTYDDFARLLAELPRLNVMEGLMLFLEKLQSEDRVKDCQVAASGYCRVNVNDLLSCFDDEQADWKYQPLLRQMSISPINHLTVDILLPDQREQSASSPLDFLRVDPFRNVTRLDIMMRLSSEDKSSDEGLMHAWKCLLQEDILARLEFLRVYFGDWSNNSKRGSQVLSASVSAIALPRLESLQLDKPGSVTHVYSLLSGTPNLRCLRLRMYGLAGERTEQEHVEHRDMLLSAIGQLTSLVSLTIELHESKNSKNWIETCSWLTHAPATPDFSVSPCVHLREEVFVTMRKLVHLDSLAIRFLDERMSPYWFDSPSVQHDMQRLTAMLPRLRVLILCDFLMKERVLPVTSRTADDGSSLCYCK